MDVSVVDTQADISPTVPSQSLKRPSPKNVTKSAPKSPKRRKRDDKRSFSRELLDNDGQDEDSFSYHLSAQTRDTVLKLRRIKDPFDEDLQKVVDDVFLHIETQPEEEVNLAESALLLSSVTHVYSSQVRTLHCEVLNTAARLTGKKSPQKGRGRKKKGEEQKGEGEVDENGKPIEGNPERTANVESHDGNNNETPNGEAINAEGTNVGEGGPDAAVASGENPEATSSSEANLTEDGDAAGEATNQDGGGEATGEQLQEQIATEFPGPCTRRQSERLRKILNLDNLAKEKERDYTLKKKKYDDDPPDLISCHDEWSAILESISAEGDIDYDEILPPELEVQVGRRRKKVPININEETDDGNCEACQSDESQKEERRDENAIKAIMSSRLGGPYETLHHLSDDVQERFHALIQEMHKLPFDYGLMQKDMFKTYQNKFLQAVTLLSQNSVLVKRNEAEASSSTGTKDKNGNVDLNDSQSSETDQTISSIAELLNQVRQQASEEINKGKSKTDAEVPIGQMIATLKRIICSRYKKWHVRTDGDKAVYRRIKEFEDRVKAVLKREAEQGLFDVKKYEMEVMDVTLQSQELDTDGYVSPTYPGSLQDGAVSPRPEDSKLWNMSGVSRRTSVAGSVDSSSCWIRLLDIFSHMKKIDNSETCRHFYAVLALLSHKNLSINYYALFSHESAKLISKLMKKQKECVINPDKYPVGAKIMTSRCPDIDRDEVFLVPVFNPDNLRLALEQDCLSSSGYQSDSQGSSSTSFSPAKPKTIRKAIDEFVIDPGEPFSTDNLFGSRRRKK